jgi:hypothetical protein
MDLITDIVTEPVSASELRRAVDVCSAARQAKDQTETHLLIIAEFIDELEPEHISAIMFRMEALARLIRGERPDSWTIELDGKHQVLARETVLEAAAAAALLVSLDQNEIGFEPESFKQLALGFPAGAGHA